MKKAAIDIGTNSTRLIIADVFTNHYQTLTRECRVTRLGEDVNETGRLSFKAMERTLKVLMIYKAIIESYGLTTLVNVTATSAARDAQNSHDFIKLVKKETGLQLRIIDAGEEARSAFLGATYTLDPDKTYAVLDIGGGSTEIVIGSNRQTRKFFSKDIGCVRLYERFIKNDPPDESEIQEIRMAVEQIYGEAIEEIKKQEPFELIGTAGTITSLAAIILGLQVYNPQAVHQTKLSQTQLYDAFRRLSKMTAGQRIKIPTMVEGRQDVIVSGSVILLKLMEMLDKEEITVSETDILDGLVLSA